VKKAARIFQTILFAFLVLSLTLGAAPASPVTTAPAQAGTEGPEQGSAVARVYFSTPDQLAMLTSHLDVWEVNHAEGYLVALLTADDQTSLAQGGYRIVVDEKKTAELFRPRQPLPGQINGIPGYPCYRTVEETNIDLATLAANHPTLAQWIDIGDSWEKVIFGGLPGYDINALILTNQEIPGPKPRFMLMAEIHAREYVTAETAARFAEYLVNNYGTDPDITMLLDFYEIHIIPLTNPDGRKKAEQGIEWRKNTDNDDGCSNSSYWGVDLNRNSSWHWGGGGSSGYACDETYRGPSAASEPETQTIQNYAMSILEDQRGPGMGDPAPADTEGAFITLHSYSQLVLWPWGDTSSLAPNGTQLQTFGRKMAYFNGYTPQQSFALYATTGTSDDWAYGELGVAAYTFEMGTNFFQSCSSFESTIYPDNLESLLYAFKASRRPYQNPAGPDSLNVLVSPAAVGPGAPVTLTATADDTRYKNTTNPEPTQNIAAARYSVATPGWIDGTTTYPMQAADGAFNAKTEAVQAEIDTTGWAPGKHTLFVESQDAAGNWGVTSAAFLYIIDPAVSPILQGYVRDAQDNSPLDATINAGLFTTTTNPATGFYSMQVISGTYDITASAAEHSPVTVQGVVADDYQTIQQDFYLSPICSIFSDDVENGANGWTAQAPWAITTESANSPTHSWTDSPGGNYGNNRNISLTSPVIDLSEYTGAELSFFHKIITEPSWDFGYVETSTNGTTWNTIAIYDGNHASWAQESLPINGLAGSATARIRFRFTTDGNTVYDGWHVDDISITGGGPGCVTELPPTAEFSSNSPVPLGTPVQFTDLTTGTPPFEYEWDFGDGGTSSEANPQHTYASAGAFDVTLAVTNFLGTDSITHEVLVTPVICTDLTGLDLSLGSGDVPVAGVPVPFSLDLAPDGATKPYHYSIDYGDGSPAESGSSSDDPFSLEHTFAAAGDYTVNVSAWNCSDANTVSTQLALTVAEPDITIPLISVDLQLVSEAPLYPGDLVSFSADFTPDNATMPYTYTVNFGDGSEHLTGTSSLDPLPLEHAYAGPGIYDVEFTAYNVDPLQTVSAGLQVIVSLRPIDTAVLTIVTPDVPAPGDLVEFQADLGPDAAAKPYTYTLDYGDGTPLITLTGSDDPLLFEHAYAAAGAYTLTLSVWNEANLEPVTVELQFTIYSKVFLPVVTRE